MALQNASGGAEVHSFATAWSRRVIAVAGVGGAPTGVGGRAAVGGAAGGRAESHPHASMTAPPRLPHYPSKLAREGRIRNFVPNFGIEDRDGGGVIGLASNRKRWRPS